MAGMKKNKIILPLFTILFVLLLAGHFCCVYGANNVTNTSKREVSSDVALQVDGKNLQCDVMPYIADGRTYVPFRAIGEALGAEVIWDAPSEMATYVWRGMRVQVSLNSENAFVNGTWVTLDAKAELKNNRTMVPVRFVAEKLGCNVAWNDETRTVSITSPSRESMISRIHTFQVSETEDGEQIVIRASLPLENVKKAVLSSNESKNEEMCITIENAALGSDFKPLTGSKNLFGKVTATEKAGNTVEIRIQLKRRITGQVSFSPDERMMTVMFREESVEGTDSTDPKKTTVSKAAEAAGLVTPDWRATGKLVYLDPGHGGRDSGSVGKLNKKEYYEKNFNLSIALRVKELLETVGIRVGMTRTDDSFPALYKRASMANTAHADLCVAIHNNSNTVKSVKGTEIMWYNMPSEANWGTLTSKDLAACIKSETDAYLNLGGRGMVENSNLAMVNRCLMPSCIVECAYLSNEANLKYMLTDEFTEKTALAIARGIIAALNLSVE